MRTWDEFAGFCSELGVSKGKGRKSLRRRWTHLRALAEHVIVRLPPKQVLSLVGKTVDQLDPEENDLKAIVAYGIGAGMLEAPRLLEALEEDTRESPLWFLADLSGKAFGETIAPKICEFWLRDEDDAWEKQPAKGYFDILWQPNELPKDIRLELKASSEFPAFRFQQVRDPRMSGNPSGDYDGLLCLGVTSSSIELWLIPRDVLEGLIDDGTLTNQHGGQKIDSNTYWFVTDEDRRARLSKFGCSLEDLRDFALKVFRDLI